MPRAFFWTSFACAALALTACGPDETVAADASPPGPWSVSNGFLRDDAGRALVLRGANLAGSHKYPPYFGFQQPDDYARVREHWGMNSIRFLISWAAIEPEKGQYDDTYIAEVQKRIGWARDAGLLVVMDMHQDIYGEGFGGDGAPKWTCDASNYEGYSPIEPWMLNYLNPKVQACYDNLWASEELHQHYAEAWRRIAAALADNPAVIGFDVMNEPYWGSAVMASFEQAKLQGFYEEIVPVVRSAAPDWVAFLEPSAGRNLGVATGLTPFPFPNVVYSPHCYDSSAEQGNGFNPSNRAMLMTKIAALNDEALALNAALWVGEYGGTADSAGIVEYMDADYDGMAAVVAGSAYWSYDEGGGYSLLNGDGSERAILLDEVVRPYPQRVAGTPESVSFDETTRAFVLRYRADEAITAPTVLSVPSRVYPDGYSVTCDGCTYEKSAELLTVTAPPAGTDAELTIAP